jgi:cobalt-precorrin 5A hydrolase
MIVAGIGFRGAAETASLHAALAKAVERLGGVEIDVLATVDEKARVGAFRALADALCARIVAVAVQDLPAQDTLTHSDRIKRQFGTGSLAEAAALAAAGPGAQLLVMRVVSPDGMATAAIAKSAQGSKT